MNFSIVIGVAAMMLFAAEQPRYGEIHNAGGFGCTFSQRQERTEYLHTLPAGETILTFHDPHCMSAEGSAGFQNRAAIARVIAYPYSHADADFAVYPTEWFEPISFQRRGQCIQSRRYPDMGVAVEVTTSDGYITEVRHSITVSGCTN